MNQVAIVTGGTSGIGKATALALKASGCTVYEFSRRAQGVEGLHHIAADVTSEDSVRAAVAQVMDAEGRIDILVNNAGFGISGAIEFTSTADAKSLFDVNFFGMVNMNRAVIPIMRQAGRGRIVNLSSVAAPVPIPFQAYYSATKASVNAYAMALANELRPFGITVCAVMPVTSTPASPPRGARSARATTFTAAAFPARSRAWSTTSRPAWIPPRRALTLPRSRSGSARTTRSTPSAQTTSFSFFSPRSFRRRRSTA